MRKEVLINITGYSAIAVLFLSLLLAMGHSFLDYFKYSNASESCLQISYYGAIYCLIAWVIFGILRFSQLKK